MSSGCRATEGVALAGPRRLPSSSARQVRRATAALRRAGCRLVVGCAVGADAAVLEAAGAGAVDVRVLAAWGPEGGACASSAERAVRAHAAAGGEVRWWTGGGPEVLLQARLARRTEAVVASADALVVWLRSGSRGSLRAAECAARRGLSVVAFPVDGPLPMLGPGRWVRAGPGVWSDARRWVPDDLLDAS